MQACDICHTTCQTCACAAAKPGAHLLASSLAAPILAVTALTLGAIVGSLPAWVEGPLPLPWAEVVDGPAALTPTRLALPWKGGMEGGHGRGLCEPDSRSSSSACCGDITGNRHAIKTTRLRCILSCSLCCIECHMINNSFLPTAVCGRMHVLSCCLLTWHPHGKTL